MIRRGDIVEFRRKGFVSFILGGILRLLEPQWDGWGWHLGIATDYKDGQIWILEALSGGVVENCYQWEELEKRVRVYRWFEHIPEKRKFNRIKQKYLGAPYDVKAYFGVVFWYIIKKLTGRAFRLHDRQFMCWELVSVVCRELGKPLQDIWEYPLISEIIKKLEQYGSP